MDSFRLAAPASHAPCSLTDLGFPDCFRIEHLKMHCFRAYAFSRLPEALFQAGRSLIEKTYFVPVYARPARWTVFEFALKKLAIPLRR